MIVKFSGQAGQARNSVRAVDIFGKIESIENKLQTIKMTDLSNKIDLQFADMDFNSLPKQFLGNEDFIPEAKKSTKYFDKLGRKNAPIQSISVHEDIISFPSGDTDLTSAENGRAIDIAPILENYFLPKGKPHSEKYVNKLASQSAKYKKPVKLWIAAYNERPREVTDFEDIKLLGEGHFSRVSCVRHRLDGRYIKSRFLISCYYSLH